jgi:hypothetical protein
MMESHRTDRIDPELVEVDTRPDHWNDVPLSGNADPIPWEHEVHPAPPPRARSGRGKIVAAVIATGVFLGTGFAIGAPIYALSRWWANRPVATASLETRSPVEAQAASEPPPSEAALPSAAPEAARVVEDQLKLVAPPSEAVLPEAIPEETPETPAVPEPPVEAISSEPPPAGALVSEDARDAVPSVDPVGVESFALDPVNVESFALDSVAVESFALDPVTVEGMNIDPVTVERVTIDPVSIDGVTIDPVPINLFHADDDQGVAP